MLMIRGKTLSASVVSIAGPQKITCNVMHLDNFFDRDAPVSYQEFVERLRKVADILSNELTDNGVRKTRSDTYSSVLAPVRLRALLNDGVSNDEPIDFTTFPTQLSLLASLSSKQCSLPDDVYRGDCDDENPKKKTEGLSGPWLWSTHLRCPVKLVEITHVPKSMYSEEHYTVMFSARSLAKSAGRGIGVPAKPDKSSILGLSRSLYKSVSRDYESLGDWLRYNNLCVMTQQLVDEYISDFRKAATILLDMHSNLFESPARKGSVFALIDNRLKRASRVNYGSSYDDDDDVDLDTYSPIGKGTTFVLPLDVLQDGLPVYLNWEALSLRNCSRTTVELPSLVPLPWMSDAAFDSLVLPDRVFSGLHLLTATTTAPQSEHDRASGRGNLRLVLLQGAPGTGKTASAEILASVTHHGLYRVPLSNLLGSHNIAEALDKEMKVARSANCLVLIDEADLIVRTRGLDLSHNELVASLLSRLEYMDGVLFMTTNRQDDIDPAIRSRCSAIMTFKCPDAAGMRTVWEKNFARCSLDVKLTEAQWESILSNEMSPRDVVMCANNLYSYKFGSGNRPTSAVVMDCTENRDEFELLLDTISMVIGQILD